MPKPPESLLSHRARIPTTAGRHRRAGQALSPGAARSGQTRGRGESIKRHAALPGLAMAKNASEGGARGLPWKGAVKASSTPAGQQTGIWRDLLRDQVPTGGRFPLHGQARQRLGRLLPSSTSLPCERPFPCLLIRDIGTPESRGAEAVFHSSLKVFVCLSRRRRPCMPPNLALSAAQRISTIAPIRSSAAPACSSPRPTTGTSSPGGTISTRAHPRPSTDEIATRGSELPSRRAELVQPWRNGSPTDQQASIAAFRV